MPENSNLSHLKITFLPLLLAKKNKHGALISGQLKYINRVVRRRKVGSTSNGLLRMKTSNSRQDRPCTYKRNTETHSYIHYCCRKAVSVTYEESVSVDLVIQHVISMRRIMLSVACLALPYFSTLSHKRHEF